jgi:hypothetical protein
VQRARAGNTSSGSHLDGRAIDGGQSLQFWGADATERVTPGAREGHAYTVYVADFEAGRAAGSTTREGKIYDVRLSRQPA